jgi:hypothetical protein
VLWPTLRALEQVARMPTPLSPAALGKRFTSQLRSRRRLQPLLLTRLNRSLYRCRRLSRCCRLLGREGGAEQRRERDVRLGAEVEPCAPLRPTPSARRRRDPSSRLSKSERFVAVSSEPLVELTR